MFLVFISTVSFKFLLATIHNTLILEIESIKICTCREVALQLLQRGLFPCAPSLPSLAVDLEMLDFVQELFMNAAPNTTAWCETLEGFLSARKFKLATRVSLINS